MQRMPPSRITFRTSSRATSAVEFARVMPLLLMLVSGIVVYGAYLAVVQQLAAEAERSSTAGLSDAERASLARSCVTTNATSYPLIVPANLAANAATASSAANVFVVTVNDNAAGMFVLSFSSFVPAPPPQIARAAANPRGDGAELVNGAPPAAVTTDRTASSHTRAGLKTCLLAVAKVGW